MADRGSDRRSGTERGTDNEVELNPDGTPRHRRMGDRRDSPRIPIGLMVRYPELGGSFEEREGDVSIGGAFFNERFSPQATRVELRFKLPTLTEEVRCEGELIRVADEAEGHFAVHVRFEELPVDVELALARFIDDHLLAQSKQEG
jgi:hypothetical protein